MTVTPDYPDWLHTTQNLGKTFANFANIPVPVAQTFGPFYVGDWQAVYMRALINNAVNYYTIRLDWTLDAAALQPVGSHTYTPEPGLLLLDVVPVIGNFVFITVTPLVSPDLGILFLDLFPRNTYGKLGRGVTNGVLSSGFVAGVAAGGNTAFSLGVVVPGPAQLTVFTGATSWELVAQRRPVTVPSQVDIYTGSRGTTRGITQLVTLGPYPYLFTFTNNGALAADVFFSLITEWAN